MIKKFINWIKSLFRDQSVFYIHSSEILPEPLCVKEERKYLLLSRDGDLKARNVLIEHNLRLVVYIAKKFESKKVNIDDLISIGSMGLIKGVRTFDITKNIKLATYASRCIENEILMFLRKIAKIKNEISLDETLNIDGDGNELLLSDILGTTKDEAYKKLIKDEEKKYMYKSVQNLPQRERDIITLRFGLFGTEPLTQKEVAIYLGISQSYISRLEKRIISKMKHDILTELNEIK